MISIVIPAFNEGAGIAALYERISTSAKSWGDNYEVLVVDDGSTDDTFQRLNEIALRDNRWRVLSLSRNFGHQPAVTAGLQHARGDLVVVLDADLQDPPEELARLLAKAREGYDVVYGIRTRRKEGPLKRFAYFSFYRFLALVAEINIPLDSGDFCVMSRRVVDALNALPERNRFVRGLRSWVGFSQTGVAYERHGRFAGASKHSLPKLTRLAFDGIFGFSSRPLRLIGAAGLLLAAIAISLAGLVLLQYLCDWTILGYNPRQTQGWTSLMLVVLFLGSAQLISLGILGAYIGRIFDEIKHRPIYVISQTVNGEPPRKPPAIESASELESACDGKSANMPQFSR